MAENYATPGPAVEIPPQEIDPKDIAREVLKIAQECTAACVKDWYSDSVFSLMAGLCAWRTDTASSGRQA